MPPSLNTVPEELALESHRGWAVVNNPKKWGKKPGRNLNHPKKGSRIRVDPIRTKSGILSIKRLLADKPRDLALFVLGINTAYRANELLSLTIGQVKHLEAGDTLDIFQTKTKKYRRVVLNGATVEVIQNWVNMSGLDSMSPLFVSQKGGALTVPTVNNMIKSWCREVGLPGNYGSHTLRKTWGYWQRKDNNTPLPLLMSAFGHSTQQQTLDYLGIQSEEIAELYHYEL